MSDTALSTVEQRTTAALVNWNDPKMQMQIKETYGKNLNDAEWQLFVGLGVATGLNPFLREIWAVKYGTNAASVFIGRDGYRRSAQNHPEYEYHQVDAVYSGDTFEFTDNGVVHKYNLKERGTLLGAYCIVKRKTAQKVMMNYVELKEYVQKFGVWTTKPATMIKKVAEAQGLRGAFQELFAGTYEESEDWQDKKPSQAMPQATGAPTQPTSPPKPSQVASRPPVVDAEIVEPPKAQEAPQPPHPAPVAPPAGRIRPEQTRKLFAVWGEYLRAAGIDTKESATRRKALIQETYGVETSTKLTDVQADDLIAKIEGFTFEATR